MKLVFASNYLNHHQEKLCENFYRLLKKDFKFVSMGKMREERKNLGYKDDLNPEYLIKYDEKNSKEEFEKYFLNSDVVIGGSSSEAVVKKCIRKNKIIFRYSERPLKLGFEPVKYIPRLIKWNLKNFPSKKIYLLCASAYTAGDYKKFGLFKKRAYKWGYFPETRRYAEDIFEVKEKTKILWVGRFLDWKRPCDAIEAINLLKKNRYDFVFQIIGAGVLEEELRKKTTLYGLDDCVEFLGTMSPEEVRGYMEKAGIYLFTSDKNEGWGAVLNESMNSGCAVVASHEIGSVPFLIKNGENGFVYESGNINKLYEKIKYLLDNPDEQKRAGINAYRTITEEWNAEIAAERFAKLAESILSGEEYPDLYQNGPCSKAEIIDESWFKG